MSHFILQKSVQPRARFIIAFQVKVVESTAPKTHLNSEMSFRVWNFASTHVSLHENVFKNFNQNVLSNSFFDEAGFFIQYTGCIDTKCGPTLMDKDWLKQQIFNAKIHKMFTPLKVRGIGSSKHKSNKCVTEFFYFPAFNKANENILACIKNELHIINGLQVNLFIENDILGSEGLTLDITQGKVYIPGCNTIIKITSRPKSQFTSKIFHANSHIIIFSRSQKIIPVRALKLFEDKDFLFEPTTHWKLTFYAHFVDHYTTGNLAQNESNKPIQISKYTKLGEISEILYNNCFQTSLEPNMAKSPPFIFFDKLK